MQILIKAFPQSCRYCQYISFAILDTPVPVLGADQFVFPCNVVFARLQLKKFWAWAETKTGICWSRIKAKVSDKFQTLWIFNMFTCSNSIPSFVLGLNINMWTCWRSRVFEICQMGKSSSTLWKYLKLIAILIMRCCKSSNTNCNTYIKLTAEATALRW